MIKFEFKVSKVMLAAQGNIRTRRLDLESEFRRHFRTFPSHPIHSSTQSFTCNPHHHIFIQISQSFPTKIAPLSKNNIQNRFVNAEEMFIETK
jgi:hypothetical protein